MRKILGILLSVLMMANIIILPVSAEDSASKAERVMRGLGIFAENYEPDREISRAEFAKALCDVMHLQDPDYDYAVWKQNVMASNDGEVTIAAGEFDDVDASHPYYTEITLVGQNGIMKGIGNRLFAPEYGITANEVSKILIDMMGYSICAINDGGYPSGYASWAYSLGIMQGVSIKSTSPVTEKALIDMMYNSFEIRLMEMTYGTDAKYEKTDDTFMTGVLQLGRVRGYVTDNGFSALHGKTALTAGKMKVGDVEINSKKNGEDLSEYLGYRVELYYTENDDEKYLEYAEIINNDDMVRFDVTDFVSYSNGAISFYSGDKKVNKRLSADAEMIFNNEWKQSFTAEDFKFADGNITLIQNESGEYATIVVKSFEFAVVSGKDTGKEQIYNKITNNSSEKVYDFSGSDVPKKSIFICDENGKKIGFDSITAGSVLNIIKSDTYMKVICGGNAVENFKVNGINEDGSEKNISNGETVYRLAGAFASITNSDALENAHTYNLYLNMFGKVIWIEGAKADSNLHIAVFTRARYFDNEKEEKSRCISLFTDEGKLKNYAVDKKFTVNGEKLKYSSAMSLLNRHKGEAVRYRIDDTGKLAEIIIASKINTKDYSEWYQIADTSSSFTYGTQGGDFSNQFYTSSSTLKFTIPNNEDFFDNEDYFSLNSVTFIDNKSDYKLSAFVADKDNVVADAIVLKQDTAAAAGTVREAEAILIQDIIRTVNEDNDEVLRISGYAVGLTVGAPKLLEYDIDEECKMLAFGETAEEVDKTKPETEVGPRTVGELGAGDIIYYETNIQNEIANARIAFDYSTGKAFDGGRGTDHYDPTKTGTAVNTTWVGKAISTYGNGIRLAIDCEPGDVDYENMTNFRKQTSAFVIRKTDSIFIVTKGRRNKINIQSGGINDIKTYNNTGDGCDNVVVLTYWSSGNYTTVAYRD